MQDCQCMPKYHASFVYSLSTVSHIFRFSLFSAGDLRNFSKVYMADFIELYKSYPCLRKTKSSDYKNRNKKDRAYSFIKKKKYNKSNQMQQKTL